MDIRVISGAKSSEQNDDKMNNLDGVILRQWLNLNCQQARAWSESNFSEMWVRFYIIQKLIAMTNKNFSWWNEDEIKLTTVPAIWGSSEPVSKCTIRQSRLKITYWLWCTARLSCPVVKSLFPCACRYISYELTLADEQSSTCHRYSQFQQDEPPA